MLFRVGQVRGLNLTQRAAGANMSVDVNLDGSYAGALLATSANVPYIGWIDAVTNCTVSASSPANPRIDTVVAWVDLSALSSGVTNNVGAFKFTAVAGTPGAVPVAPNAAAIQAAIGASNPYIALGNLAIATSAASVVNANITDTRVMSALAISRLWGGALNTLGHLVPNFADDTVALLNAAQTVKGKSLSLTGVAATGNILTNPYKFSAYPSATVAISSALQKVALNTELFDSGSNFDSTANYRFTAPVSGFYQFNAQAAFGSAGMGTTEYGSAVLYKNGAVLRASQAQNGSGTAALLARGQVTAFVQLAAGDYIELYVAMGGVYRDIVGGSNVTWLDGYLVSHL